MDVHSEFPHEVEHIFKPPCVPLWRCSGCCGDESLECVAVETRTIDLEVWDHSSSPLLLRRALGEQEGEDGSSGVREEQSATGGCWPNAAEAPPRSISTSASKQQAGPWAQPVMAAFLLL